jgi:hypothetical protein
MAAHAPLATLVVDGVFRCKRILPNGRMLRRPVYGDAVDGSSPARVALACQYGEIDFTRHCWRGTVDPRELNLPRVMAARCNDRVGWLPVHARPFPLAKSCNLRRPLRR